MTGLDREEIETFVLLATRSIGLVIPPGSLPAVVENVVVLQVHAARVMAFPVGNAADLRR